MAGQRYTLALYDRDWDAAGRASALLSQKNSLAVVPVTLAATFGWV